MSRDNRREEPGLEDLLQVLESEEDEEKRRDAARRLASLIPGSGSSLPERMQERVQALYGETWDHVLAASLLKILNRGKLLQRDVRIPDYQHLQPIKNSPQLERAYDSLRRVHDRDKQQENSLSSLYDIHGAIAHGGMATLFHAVRKADNYEVAIKFLSDQYAHNKNIRARFQREYDLLHSLDHPNIIRVFDFGSDGERWFIVMEYVRGGDLTRYASASTEAAWFLELFREVCSGLQAVHDKGIIHRDIKPHNILLDTTNGGSRPKLTDFGLAAAPAANGLTRSTMKMGTTEFSSPEQLANPKDVGVGSDIYSLGATIYFALSGGEVPSGDYVGLHQIRSDVTPKLQEVMETALARKPGDRWSSAEELARALEDAEGSDFTEIMHHERE